MAQNALISSLVISVGLFVAACTGTGVDQDAGDASDVSEIADAVVAESGTLGDSGSEDGGSGEDANEDATELEDAGVGADADACDGCA